MVTLFIFFTFGAGQLLQCKYTTKMHTLSIEKCTNLHYIFARIAQLLGLRPRGLWVKKIPSEKSGGMRNFTYARALQTLKAAFLSQAGAL
jgi:hypothetical protein